MSLFTANLLPGTVLANVGWRFYNAAGAISARQTTGVTQPVSGQPIFAIEATPPAGALILLVDDSSDSTNNAPITLTFARGDELGIAEIEALPANGGRGTTTGVGRHVKFAKLLEPAVQLCGLDYANLPTTLAQCFAAWLEARVEEAWMLTQWPDTLVLEERGFRPRFSLATVYSINAEVYDPASGLYFRAIADSFNGEPAEDGAYWEEFTPTDRTIAFDEENETAIGEVLHVWKHDPRTVTAPAPVNFWSTADSAILEPGSGASVWVQFRRPAPRFTAALYDAGTTYAEGDVVYRAGSGDCFLARQACTGQTPESRPQFWDLQRTPAVLARYAQRAARADFLADDGQEDKALLQSAGARTWLADRLADLTIHQGQTRSYSVV